MYVQHPSSLCRYTSLLSGLQCNTPMGSENLFVSWISKDMCKTKLPCWKGHTPTQRSHLVLCKNVSNHFRRWEEKSPWEIITNELYGIHSLKMSGSYLYDWLWLQVFALYIMNILWLCTDSILWTVHWIVPKGQSSTVCFSKEVHTEESSGVVEKIMDDFLTTLSIQKPKIFFACATCRQYGCRYV